MTKETILRVKNRQDIYRKEASDDLDTTREQI